MFWNVKPEGILHVGAHEAEEMRAYSKAGWLKNGGIIWVEAQPLLANRLLETIASPNSKVINAAVWDKDDVPLTLKITSNKQSTSLLELGTHARTYPDIFVEMEIQVNSRRLDSLLKITDKFDFINLDIQGAELQALIGLGSRINEVRWIYTECNSEEVYKGCTLIHDLDHFLELHGFKRVATKWARGAGWGDCLYVKSSSDTFSNYAKYAWMIYVGILSITSFPKRMLGRKLRQWNLIN